MTADLIAALAALLWPLLTLTALLLLWRPLTGLLRRSDIDLELGGQKITVTQLNDQQNRLITDLQHQVAMLREQVEVLSGGTLPAPADAAPAAPGAPPPAGAPDRPVSRDVLWVDDHPERNALMIDGLQQAGVSVTLARSTREAIERIEHGRYGAVISDMHRHEDGTDVPTAGLHLLHMVHEFDPAIPFVIYAGEAAVRAHGDRARADGAMATTSSEMTVQEALHTAGVLSL